MIAVPCNSLTVKFGMLISLHTVHRIPRESSTMLSTTLCIRPGGLWQPPPRASRGCCDHLSGLHGVNASRCEDMPLEDVIRYAIEQCDAPAGLGAAVLPALGKTTASAGVTRSHHLSGAKHTHNQHEKHELPAFAVKAWDKNFGLLSAFYRDRQHSRDPCSATPRAPGPTAPHVTPDGILSCVTKRFEEGDRYTHCRCRSDTLVRIHELVRIRDQGDTNNP